MARSGAEFIPMAVLHDNPGVTLAEYTSLLNDVYSNSGGSLKSEHGVGTEILQSPSYPFEDIAFDSDASRGIFNKNIFWHMMHNIEPEIGWVQNANRFELDTNSILDLKGNYNYKSVGNGDEMCGEPIRDYVWTSILLTSEVIRTSSWERIGPNIPTEYLDTDSAEFLLKNPDSLLRVRLGLLSLYDCALVRKSGLT